MPLGKLICYNKNDIVFPLKDYVSLIITGHLLIYDHR